MSSDFLPNSSSSLNLEFGEASFTKFFEGENVRMHLQQSIHTFGNKIEHGEETCLTNCVEYKYVCMFIIKRTKKSTLKH